MDAVFGMVTGPKLATGSPKPARATPKSISTWATTGGFTADSERRKTMGLTIHYRLTTEFTNPKNFRQLVETIRQHALDLPFKEVGEVKEFTGNETDYRSGDEEDRWLKIQSSGYVAAGRGMLAVAPLHVIALPTWPGEGCKYPAFFPSPPKGKKVPTRLSGWRWTSFCKTQYASDPKAGGVENFLRCHLSVIKVLDFIKQTGLVT